MKINPRLLLITTAVVALLSCLAQAATGTVKGKVLTFDPATNTMVIRKSNGKTASVKLSKQTTIQRNGHKVPPAAIVLLDKVTAELSGKARAAALTLKGPASQRFSGAVTDVVKGTGTLKIGDTIVTTNASTRISRNGVLVSLSSLTLADSVTAHVPPALTVASNVGVATPAVAPADDAFDLIVEGPENDDGKGVISAIAGDQVTITPANGTAAFTVTVTLDTLIEVDGDHAPLASLDTGMTIEVTFDPATFIAFSIETDSEGESDQGEVSGAISAIRLADGQVDILNAANETVTLNVDASTEVQANDANGTLADLTVGMPVRAEYDLSTSLATEIDAGSSGQGEDGSDSQDVTGTITAVDPVAGTVSIGSGSATLTVNVVAGTEIQVDGDSALFSALTVGLFVQIHFDPVTFNADKIETDNPEDSEVRGTIFALGADTVIITPKDGSANVTITVDADTALEVNGEDGTFADLVVGMPIKAQYDSGSAVASEVQAGDGLGGGGGGGGD